jgi:hypothetical protein
VRLTRGSKPMFQSLLKSLSQFGHKRRPGPFGTPFGRANIEAVVRFESLAGELHLAAMQIAVVTSGVNALQAGIKLKNALSLQDLGPQIPEPGAIELPRACREELGVAYRNIVLAQDLFRELEPAQEDVEMFCTDAEKFGEDTAAALDLPSVSQRWRRLSVRALAAVIDLEPDVARCLPARYAENTALLKRLLRSTAEGGHPCVGSDCIIKLPDLPQRRAAVRPNARLACVVEYHGMTFDAVVKDISTGGVGLDDAPPMRAQTVVLIEFEGGDCLPGLVVWSEGSRAGIKFDLPLKPNHQLLVQRAA